MEAEVGTPIEYNPDEFTNKEMDDQKDQERKIMNSIIFHPRNTIVNHTHNNPFPKKIYFPNLDKTAYVIIFVSFILGFFHG